MEIISFMTTKREIREREVCALTRMGRAICIQNRYVRLQNPNQNGSRDDNLTLRM